MLYRLDVECENDNAKIKEKMLNDQVDTIKCLRTVSNNTKKTLDEERAQKKFLEDEVSVCYYLNYRITFIHLELGY